MWWFNTCRIPFLYIPLRSDKTITRFLISCIFLFFISHYVQIKRLPFFPAFVDFPFFISHYVQIKLCDFIACFIDRVLLYIPLRSDKTSRGANRDGSIKIFISHYVQIKLHFFDHSVYFRFLYIPLRSDKTWIMNLVLLLLLTTLYPTTFR